MEPAGSGGAVSFVFKRFKVKQLPSQLVLRQKCLASPRWVWIEMDGWGVSNKNFLVRSNFIHSLK